MQLNTDSTTAARVEAPPWRGRVLDPVPTYAALVLAVLFFLYLSLDFSRERKWLEERKKRMAHFRDEARRRHNELVTAHIQARQDRKSVV